jgi:hypothetical protein
MVVIGIAALLRACRRELLEIATGIVVVHGTRGRPSRGDWL